MELALFTEPQVGGTYQQLVDLARWSEEQGLDAFARSDHYLNGSESTHTTDALASIAGLSGAYSSPMASQSSQERSDPG